MTDFKLSLRVHRCFGIIGFIGAEFGLNNRIYVFVVLLCVERSFFEVRITGT